MNLFCLGTEQMIILATVFILRAQRVENDFGQLKNSHSSDVYFTQIFFW